MVALCQLATIEVVHIRLFRKFLENCLALAKFRFRRGVIHSLRASASKNLMTLCQDSAIIPVTGKAGNESNKNSMGFLPFGVRFGFLVQAIPGVCDILAQRRCGLLLTRAGSAYQLLTDLGCY